MAQKVSNSCLYCKKNIKGRQLALGCSICCRWQHRKCNMGIDVVVYRVMVQGTITWKCLDCRPAPKEPEDMTQKELFLNHFSLGRSVGLTDLTGKTEFLPNGVDWDVAGHNSPLQEEAVSTVPSHESRNLRSFKADNMELDTEQDSIGDEIISDIPWLPRTKTVYSEALSQGDESFILQDSIDDEPSFTMPWLPKIVSVYSEALAQSEECPEWQNKVDDEPNMKLSWLPKIESVYSEASEQDINVSIVEADPVYKTCWPIENCPTCHKVLVPMQFKVNVVTAVMKTTCQCGLSIEIYPEPSYSKTAVVHKKRKRSETIMSMKRLRLS